MKLPIRTTLPTGNKKKGFTFVEVMVTLVILSAGIVLIYKTFFMCVDYLSRLSMRLHANEMIDSKIADITKYIHSHKDLGFDRMLNPLTQTIGTRKVEFQYHIDIHPVSGLENLYLLDVGLSWQEYNRKNQFKRFIFVNI